MVKNQGKNSVDKEVQKIVRNGKPTGSVVKETIAVSVTISISVQNRHSRIRLRGLLRGRLREMHREHEVLEVEAQVEECLDCRARMRLLKYDDLWWVSWSMPLSSIRMLKLYPSHVEVTFCNHHFGLWVLVFLYTLMRWYVSHDPDCFPKCHHILHVCDDDGSV